MRREAKFLLSSDKVRFGGLASREPSAAAEIEEAVQSAALAGTMQQLIDDLPEQIALLDERCRILAVNLAWRHMAEKHCCPDSTPGHDYREFCARQAARGYQPAIKAVSALDDMASGRRSFCHFTYNGANAWDRDFQLCFRRISVGTRNLIQVTRFDLTEVSELRRAKNALSHSLIEGQAVERQRMARELHDSTSQLLTGIGLLLSQLKQQLPSRNALSLVDEIQDLLRETEQGIRSISYLAHPPSLEKLGLAGAMKALVEGFARRTGLEASFQVEGGGMFRSAAADDEGVLYRIAQEALSNVYRHARATRISVLLSFRPFATHLVIADNGIGISPESRAGRGTAGVGLASMRSRLADIGGRLSVVPLSPGTAIIASARERQSDAAGEAKKAEQRRSRRPQSLATVLVYSAPPPPKRVEPVPHEADA